MKIRRSFPVRELIVLTIATVWLLSGCASNSSKSTAKLEDVLAQENNSSQEIKQINEKLRTTFSRTPTMQDYVLGEGDLVQVSIFEAADLKSETRVSARGGITLPLLGAVSVKGLTAREAEQKIEAAYKKKYIRDPHVSLFVKEQVSGKVTVLGAVKKPGTIPYLTRQTVFEVLAASEGLSENAGRTVQVTRAGEAPAHPSTFFIDLDELVKGGKNELNIEIKSGDVVYVSEAGTVYVDGAVRKPGNIPIKQKMTVQEAIVAAGGFSSVAEKGNIKLVRMRSDGKREITELNVSDIQNGSHNLQMQDRDVVFVETNTLKAVVYGLRLNLGSGLFGFGYAPPGQTY